MAFPQGIDFRATAGYVTDPVNCDYELASGSYPRVTAQGNTVGWDSPVGINPRDRSLTNDPRLAGTNFFSLSVKNYRFDLPSSGSYDIRIAAGDATGAGTNNIELFDNASSLGVIVNNTPLTNSFVDATNVNRTAAAWPGSNVAITATFSSTICIFKFASTALNEIAHIFVQASGGGGGITGPLIGMGHLGGGGPLLGRLVR